MEGASKLPTEAPAGRVVADSLERIRLSRAPLAKYKRLSEQEVTPMDRALAYFRKVVEEANDPSGRALAKEDEFTCEALCVLLAPREPLATGARPCTSSLR